MKIEKDRVVAVDYVVSDEEDNIIDSSDEGSPMTYLHGYDNIVPGLEAALEGKGVGDQIQVTVSPELGYGEIDPDLIQQVPRSDFDDLDEPLEVGLELEAEDEEGDEILVIVTEISDDQVTLDANHPLAGMALNFDVKVVAVRASTEEERTHGHAHDADGHAH